MKNPFVKGFVITQNVLIVLTLIVLGSVDAFDYFWIFILYLTSLNLITVFISWVVMKKI